MAWTATTYAIIQAVIAVASIAYQQQQARKIKRRAASDADRRKGFQLVTEGEVTEMPIVYGRALIGGSRAYHNTSNVFKYAAPNSDKVFLTGPPAIASGTYDEIVSDGGDSGSYHTVPMTYEAVPAGTLTHDMDGEKNEFLFVQQALCQGPINRVYDVIFDGSKGLGDPALGTRAVSGVPFAVSRDQTSLNGAALRVDIHNGVTPTADAIMSANHGQRSTAKFSGLAYASMVFRLNRDDPQFNAVPVAQFILEGRLVRTLSGGVLSGYVYSTNPVWCLLDYLLTAKNLSLSKINTASFEAAAAICNTQVMTNAAVGGKIWQPTDGYRNVTTRNIPLYECNTIIDVLRPMRENVEKILATMGDARMVWSGGKYKLQLQYPASNSAVTLAATLGDDDIQLDSTVEINWPSSAERLNNISVRFANESSNFSDDSVSWPPKTTGTILRGIGNTTYPVVSSSNWEDKYLGGALLNAYAVWLSSVNPALSTMTWKFAVKTTGVHTLSWSADNVGVVYLNSVLVNGSSNYQDVNVSTFTATKDDIITILTNVQNIGVESAENPKGFAGKVVDSLGMLVWNSRSPAYTDFTVINQSSLIYDTMLVEDNGVKLESDVELDGAVDYYHALAKAEELVRTSRSAFTIKFNHIVKNNFLEPGDIIKINSPTLSLTDVYIKVGSAKLKNGSVAEIEGTRFDASQLAWNVADNHYTMPKNVYDFEIPRPQFITVDRNVTGSSSGSVDWSVVSDNRVIGYKIYVHNANDNDSRGFPIYSEVGTAAYPPFALPSTGYFSGSVAVKTLTKFGASDPLVSESLIFNYRSVYLTQDIPGFIKDNTGVFNQPTATITATTTGYDVPLIRWYVDNVLVEDSPGVPRTATTLIINAFTPGILKIIKFAVEETAFAATDVSLKEAEVSLYSVESGVVGLSSQLLTLLSDSQTFKYDTSNTATPGSQTITFAIVLNNLSGTPTSTCQLYDASGGSLGAVTLGGSGIARTLTNAQFGSAASAVVTASLLGYSDTKTIVRLRDGAAGQNALSGILTNESHTISADSGGTLTDSLSSAGGTFKVFYGNTDVTTSATFAKSGESGLTATINATTGVYTINTLTSDVGTVTFSATYNGITIPKVYSISKSRQGVAGAAATDALFVSMSNERHIFTADSTGAVSVYTGSGNIISVFEGSTQLDYDGVGTTAGKWTVSTTPTNITAGSITDTGLTATIAAASSITQDVANIAYSISGKFADGTSFALVKVQSFSKAKQGTVGTNGSAYWLGRSVAAIRKSVAGVYTPSSITFSGYSATGTSSPTAYAGRFVISTTTNGSSYTTQYTSASNESSTTYAVPSNIVAMKVEFYFAGGTTTKLDEEIVNVVQDGATGLSAITVDINNQNAALPATAAGVVTDYTLTQANVKVFEGTTLLNYDGVGTSPGTWKIVITAATDITPGAVTDIGTAASIGSASGFTTGADFAFYTVNISGAMLDGTAFGVINVARSFTKSKQGVTGAAGTNTALVRIYRRFVALPSLPTNNLVYTFATASCTAPNSGWSLTVPSGADPLWVSEAYIASVNPTFTIIPSDNRFYTPVIMSQDGAPGSSGSNGYNNATVTLYQRTISNVAPALPNGTLDYNFTTGVLSGAGFNGWSTSIPTTGGPYRWVTNAVAFSQSSTDVIQSAEWFAAALQSTDGASGADGKKTADVYAYKWAVSTPSIAGLSTYTWANATYDNVPSGWSPNTSGGTVGQTLWRAVITLSNVGATVATSSIDWGTAGIGAFGRIGNDGSQGIQGIQGNQGPAGTNGINGSAGIDGAGARRAYTKTTSAALGTGQVVVVGLPPTGSYGTGLIWTASPPSLSTDERLFQSDGIYTPSNGQTTWESPYLSNFKVGSLAAFQVNTGNINVDDSITLNPGGLFPNSSIHSGIFTSAWAWPSVAGSGFLIHTNGILLGSANFGAYLQLQADGTLYSPYLTLTAGGALFSGQIRTGSNPVRTGSTMTGVGGAMYPDGTFAFGDSLKSFVRDSSGNLNLNGAIVTAANISGLLPASLIEPSGMSIGAITGINQTVTAGASFGPASIGSRTAVATGGTAPYSYTWSALQTSEFNAASVWIDTISGATASFSARCASGGDAKIQLTVTAVDANGYIATKSFSVRITSLT